MSRFLWFTVYNTKFQHAHMLNIILFLLVLKYNFIELWTAMLYVSNNIEISGMNLRVNRSCTTLSVSFLL